MNKNNVSLKISAGRPDQIVHDGIPQIAFSGRSNVGKSSLINKLLNRKSLARVSGEPGKTVTLNYYNVDNSVYLVDLPGYGFARRSDADIKKWSALVESFFDNNHSLDLVVQLVDLKVGLTRDDEGMLNWLCETGTPFVIAATKSDKLNATGRAASLKALEDSPFVPEETEIIPFSSKSGEGTDRLWNIVAAIAKK